jgi:acetolactate synthase-1/2/3 large subunit
MTTTIPKTQTYADLMVRALHQMGVRHAFGVPGGAVEPAYDALHRAQVRGDIRFTTTRHEAAAVSMAEGVTRATGMPAISCGTTGPGAMNMITAAASAAAECQPVILLTAQAALPRQARGALQDCSDSACDTVALFRGVCKFSSAVTHSAQLLPKLRQALTLAMSEPRGPVHLSLPPDIMKAPACATALAKLADDVSTWVLEPAETRLGTGQATRLTSHFAASVRPVVVLGEEARPHAKAIMAFVEQQGWPVVSTPGGHGWFPTAHPLYYGELGLGGHDAARELVAQADAVLVLGSYFRDLCMSATPAMYLPKVLHVAPSSKAVQGTTESVRIVHVGIPAALEALGATAPRMAPAVHARPSLSALPNTSHLDFSTAAVALPRVLADLRPQTTVLDAGNAWCWASHYLAFGDGNEAIRSAAFGQMAWAIPAAMGYALASPDKRVVAVTGDGSWLMCSAELTTAVQERIPAVFVVLKDGNLGMVMHGQRMGGAEPAGFELPPVDYVALANAMGADALRVACTDDLGAVRDWAARTDHTKPLLIELVIDPEFAPPMQERIKQLQGAV